jgi:hypothetical protein
VFLIKKVIMSNSNTQHSPNAVDELLDRLPELETSLFSQDILGRDVVDRILRITSVGSVAIGQPRFPSGNNPNIGSFGEVVVDDAFMRGLVDKTIQFAGHVDRATGEKATLRYLDTIPHRDLNQLVGYNRTALFLYGVRVTDAEANMLGFWQGYNENARKAAPWFIRMSLFTHEDYRKAFDGTSCLLNKVTETTTEAVHREPPLDVPLLDMDKFIEVYDEFKETDAYSNTDEPIFEHGSSIDIINTLYQDVLSQINSGQQIFNEITQQELLTELKDPVVASEDNSNNIQAEPLVIVKTEIFDWLRVVFGHEFIDVAFDENTGMKVDLIQHGSRNYLIQHLESINPGYSWVQIDLFAERNAHSLLVEALSSSKKYQKKVVRS